MDAGADGNAGWRGCDGRTLIGAAVHGESNQIVTALLKAGARNDINVTFRKGESPLHIAAARGVENVSKVLMHAGANPNLKDHRGRTPLHVAAQEGHGGIVSDMLLKGARPDAKDRTDLWQTPLHLAAAGGHARCVSELLLGGASMDVLNIEGKTPLHLATLHNHVGVVEELCAAGCDLDLEAGDGLSALDLAMQSGTIDAVRVLLAHSADVNTADLMDYTPLHRLNALAAPSRDNGPVVRLLVEAGADIEAKAMSIQLTPLHLACIKHASAGTVRALLEAGANVNAISGNDSTPLLFACNQSNAASVEVLLHWGADETLGEPWSNVEPWEEDDTNPDSDAKSDDEQRRNDNKLIRRMLERAPADRSWRRRGWLILCRSCPGNLKLTHDSSASNTGKSAKKMPKASGDVSVESADVTEINQGADIGHLVREVVGLESEGVFRVVVSFL
ncbi:unnamed protein product [Hapterophycus canaliculatus]